MSDKPSDRRPNSVCIILTRSPSRQLAFRALLSVLKPVVTVLIAEDARSAVWMLAEMKEEQRLLVIDGGILDSQAEEELNQIRTLHPDTRFILLLESQSKRHGTLYETADAVLNGEFSGNQFLEVVKDLIMQSE